MNEDKRSIERIRAIVATANISLGEGALAGKKKRLSPAPARFSHHLILGYFTTILAPGIAYKYLNVVTIHQWGIYA